MSKVQLMIRSFALSGALLVGACGGGTYKEASHAAEEVYSERDTSAASGDSIGAPTSAYDQAGALGASNYAANIDEAELDDGAGQEEYLRETSESALKGGSPAPPAQQKQIAPQVTRAHEEEAALMGARDAPEAAESDARSSARPMLIYEAHLGMAVFRAQENLDAIEGWAKKSGGYLVSRGINNIQVRVPVGKFEGSLDAIMKLGDVHRREVNARDVTAEYHDVEIRLRNALAVRDRLEQLLARASNVKEALQVETQLARVTEDIERMKGRLKLLGELTAFSTITVEFTERTNKLAPRVNLPFPWLYEMGLHNLLSL